MHASVRCIGQLLVALKAAEEISRDTAWRQAGMAGDPALRAALLVQARQEAVHASAFSAALKVAAVDVMAPHGLLRALADYRARLDADLDAGRLGSSLLGLQVVFESLGAVALRPPESALSWRAAGLLPMRALLLRQEEAHHALGEAWLQRLAARGQLGSDGLEPSCRVYTALAEAALEQGIALFAGFPADQEAYWQVATARIQSIRTRHE
jgi:hypothetical protein